MGLFKKNKGEVDFKRIEELSKKIDELYLLTSKHYDKKGMTSEDFSKKARQDFVKVIDSFKEEFKFLIDIDKQKLKKMFEIKEKIENFIQLLNKVNQNSFLKQEGLSDEMHNLLTKIESQIKDEEAFYNEEIKRAS